MTTSESGMMNQSVCRAPRSFGREIRSCHVSPWLIKNLLAASARVMYGPLGKMFSDEKKDGPTTCQNSCCLLSSNKEWSNKNP
ncbi:hypothetical protein CDAR_387431 [Caerostris darwini]|uniref:Uncharacterized protein n=1 Tax=Caerostris darwini TaxID=1538125 RepID=A0AAV4MZT5_9ARAC|nr:hypothetical protein CDAR_387431 [Caerostris darwini]